MPFRQEPHATPTMTNEVVVDLRDTDRRVADISKVLCSRDHPNKPENLRCYICGEFMLGPQQALHRLNLLRSPAPPPRALDSRGW
jgi:hypothetical protein